MYLPKFQQTLDLVSTIECFAFSFITVMVDIFRELLHQDKNRLITLHKDL